MIVYGDTQVLEKPYKTSSNKKRRSSSTTKKAKSKHARSAMTSDATLRVRSIPSIEKLNREKERELEQRRARTNIKSKSKTQSKSYAKKILAVGYVFVVLLLISYRYAVINSTFTEKENLKTELASIQKQNEQLRVNIEQNMNINTIEQEAKEKLGMQKLDNNQKVYISVPKKDYTESSINTKKATNSENETWWSKFLKDVFKIK